MGQLSPTCRFSFVPKMASSVARFGIAHADGQFEQVADIVRQGLAVHGEPHTLFRLVPRHDHDSTGRQKRQLLLAHAGDTGFDRQRQPGFDAIFVHFKHLDHTINTDTQQLILRLLFFTVGHRDQAFAWHRRPQAELVADLAGSGELDVVLLSRIGFRLGRGAVCGLGLRRPDRIRSFFGRVGGLVLTEDGRQGRGEQNDGSEMSAQKDSLLPRV